MNKPSKPASKPEYNTLEIEATVQGWIVTEKGKPKQVFFLWRQLINHIESRLTTK